jgi:hypothetical protein
MTTPIRILLCCALSLVLSTGRAQHTTVKDSLAPLLTADSLASGNYKDIITSFYQLAANNLTGPRKEFRFTTNPYAILLKNNPQLAADPTYQQYRAWRKLNIDVDVRMDSSYHFDGFMVGLTYAVLDKRDITINRLFSSTYLADRGRDYAYMRLHQLADSAIEKMGKPDTALAALLTRQLDSLSLRADYPYRRVDSLLLTRLTQAARDVGCKDILTASNQLDTTKRLSALYVRNRDEYQQVYNRLVGYYIPRLGASTDKIRLAAELESVFYAPADSTLAFDKISPDLQKLLVSLATINDLTIFTDSLARNPHLVIYKMKNAYFTDLRKQFQTNWLGTVGVTDTSYADGNLGKNLQINTEWLKGLSTDPKSRVTLEADLKAMVNFTDDTAKTGRNLLRQYAYAEPGFNVVWRDKDLQSFFEFKVSGGVSYVFNGTYAGEKPLGITVNGTARVRLFNEVWIPVRIVYDPKAGKVFGFLNITANFTGLGSLASGILKK